jgi:dethiobiotin synthetase
LRAAGSDAVAMKPVASGAESIDGELRYGDIEALRTAADLTVDVEQINAYRFPPPIAPHRAAALAGTEICLAPILARYEALRERHTAVLVEGVGGIAVPLSETLMFADLARALALPAVLVVGMRLGCINHALLSAAAIRAAGVPLLGWIANTVDPDMRERDASVDAIAKRIGAPLWADVSRPARATEWQDLLERWRAQVAPAQ